MSTSLRTCNRFGWVHMGVTRGYAEDEVSRFNEYFGSSTQDVRDMFGNTPSSITAYERCFRCGGPHTGMREFTVGDCPDGCTIGPIIVELPDSPKVNS